MSAEASLNDELGPGDESRSPAVTVLLRGLTAFAVYCAGAGLIYSFSLLGNQIDRPWLGVVGLAIDVVALIAYIAWLGYRNDPLAGTLGPLLALLLLVLFFAVADIVSNGERYSFWTMSSLRTLAVQTVVVWMAALGMTVIIISAGIDLSAGVGVALSSTVLAWSLDGGINWLAGYEVEPAWVVAQAVCACIAVGVLVGAVNGGLTVGLGVAPFIVTLGTMMVLLGVGKMIAKNSTIHTDPSAIPDWILAMVGASPNPAWLAPPYCPWFPNLFPNFGWAVWLTAGMSILMALVLEFTVFGRHVFAIGSSESTARLCGIRVDATKIAIYALGGFFLGLAAIMHFGRIEVGEPGSGTGMELRMIAAVVIGGGSLNGGRGSIFGTCCGAALMQTIPWGCTALHLSNYYQDILVGVIIVVAVCIDRIRAGKLSLLWMPTAEK